MKKLFYLPFAFIVLIPLMSKAQTGHTLVFNQVLLVTSATTTVPSGTVWKISNILPGANVIASVPNYTSAPTAQVATVECLIVVGGNNIRAISAKATSLGSNSSPTPVTSTSMVHSIFPAPIWLPAGTTLAAGTNVQYISVLEFIVQ